MSNLIALVAALYFEDLVTPVLQSAGKIHLGDIQLSVLVTTGTLVAVVYAAFNSDLRGRAELNKTTSLACRTTLHACTAPLLDAAEALHEIREIAVTRLNHFPTACELEELTGRNDLKWRLTGLLPRQATPLPHSMRKTAILQPPVVQHAINQLLGYPRSQSYQDHSLATQADAQKQHESLHAATHRITDSLDQLADQGFTGKLHRTLNRAAIFFLAQLHKNEFGIHDAQRLLATPDQPWTDRVFTPAELHDLRDHWAGQLTADPDDPVLRAACRHLERQLRAFVRAEHHKHWEAAVTEYYLRYLAETIDRSLWPRLFERIRQAFGK